MVYWHAEFRVPKRFECPCENKEKLTPFLYYNQDITDLLLLYDKNTMGYPKLLEGMFHYFHDKFISNVLKLLNSPSITNHKDLDLLLEDE